MTRQLRPHRSTVRDSGLREAVSAGEPGLFAVPAANTDCDL